MNIEKFYRENKKLVWGVSITIVGSVIIYFLLKKKCEKDAGDIYAVIEAGKAKIQDNIIKIAEAKTKLSQFAEGSDAYLKLIESDINPFEAENLHLSDEVKVREERLKRFWCTA